MERGFAEERRRRARAHLAARAHVSDGATAMRAQDATRADASWAAATPDAVSEPEEQASKVAHVTLTLGGGGRIMASDTMARKPVREGSSVYIMIEPDSPDESERVFAGLAEGGTVEMELQRTGWAERHGSCTDRYGVHWMINYTGDVHSG